MTVSRLVAFYLVLLLCSSCMSQGCVRRTDHTGTINGNRYATSNCWKVIVPPASYTTLTLVSFDSDTSNCKYVSIHIEIDGKSTKYKLCPRQLNWTPIVAFNDVTIKFRILSNNDANFHLGFNSESIICSQRDSFTCSNGICLLGSQVCDGKQDCPNGVDEVGCETGVFLVDGIAESRTTSIDWLITKQSLSAGWKENTHRAITALYLVTERNMTFSDLEEELMVKQLEVQTLAVFLRNNTEEITTNQLSLFVNALLVTCQNPRNFYGYDLVTLLKRKTETSSLTTHPVAYLALCNANEILPTDATSNFKKVLENEYEYPFLLDIQAVAVMAMSCLSSRQEHSNASVIRTELLKTVQKLKTLQLQDGSFGNIYTSAIVTQALLSCKQEDSEDWKMKSAVQYLMRHLNSSSVDFLSTYLILPILNGRSLSDIGKTDCSGSPRYNNDQLEDVQNKLGPKMRIQYSLYVGDEKDIIHTISLRVPENITVYEVMQLAEEADLKYQFLWKKMGEKMYIYEIAEITNDFEDGKFWLLYKGKNVTSITHLTESPDKVVMRDGEHMIMWYKKVHI